MKPGQLVMLIKAGTSGIPVGAIGEVQDHARWSMYVPTTNVVVDFPNHPSDTASKLWHCPVTWLIPISDPDADVSDTTGMPVKEQLEVTYD